VRPGSSTGYLPIPNLRAAVLKVNQCAVSNINLISNLNPFTNYQIWKQVNNFHPSTGTLRFGYSL
jgi:hypothetical protein